jgi:hypothetical protein
VTDDDRRTAPQRSTALLVGFVPQLLLVAWFLYVALTTEVQDRRYLSYMIFPDLLIVPLCGVYALAMMQDKINRHLGVAVLTGMGTGLGLWLVTCMFFSPG